MAVRCLHAMKVADGQPVNRQSPAKLPVSYPFLCNVELRPLALRRIEATRFGIQAIRSHAPSLGLALEGRFHLLEDGSFDRAAPRMNLEEFNPVPAREMFERLKSFSRPTLSIVARCTGYNTHPECHAFLIVVFWTHE